MGVNLLHRCLSGCGFIAGICVVSQSSGLSVTNGSDMHSSSVIACDSTGCSTSVLPTKPINNVNLSIRASWLTQWETKVEEFTRNLFISPQPLDSPHYPPPRPRCPTSLCSPRRPSWAGPVRSAWSPAPGAAPTPHLQTQDSVSASPLLNPRSLPQALCHLILPHNKWVTLEKNIDCFKKLFKLHCELF